MKSFMKKRIEYLDLFRCFGIICMVMGHIAPVDVGFDHYIHAFHMPMFFIISGYLFSKKSSKELGFKAFLKRKAKSLLLPYIVLGLVQYVYYYAINDFSWDPLIHFFTVNTTGVPVGGALWFLTALFWTEIIFFVIEKYTSLTWLKLILIIGISLMGNFSKALIPFTLPWALSASMVGVGLYYSGALIGKLDIGEKLLNLSWIQSILLGGINTWLIFFNGYINLRTQIYAIIPLFWINAILFFVVGMNLSRLIYSIIKRSLVARWLVSIGCNSVVYVAFNQIVIKNVYQCMNKYIDKVELQHILYRLIILIITLIILGGISYLISHTKLKVIIGR